MSERKIAEMTGHEQKLEFALSEVEEERERQLKLKAEDCYAYTPSDDELNNPLRLAMIVEEVGEVARNVLSGAGLVADGQSSDLAQRAELCQVAALCVAWMERL